MMKLLDDLGGPQHDLRVRTKSTVFNGGSVDPVAATGHGARLGGTGSTADQPAVGSIR